MRAPRTADTTTSPSVLFSEHTLVTDADGVANVNAATVTQRRDDILLTDTEGTRVHEHAPRNRDLLRICRFGRQELWAQTD